MAKRLVAKTGEYTNQQGETKGEYTRVGALIEKDGSEFMLLDPTVNLAGVLTKQNMMSHKNNKPFRDSVMVSIYEDSNNGNAPVSNQPQQQSGGDDYNSDDVPF